MKINTLVKTQKGATLVEYGIIVTLIGAIAIPVLVVLGGNIQNTFNESDTSLTIANGVGDGTYESFEEGRLIESLDPDNCFIGTSGNDSLAHNAIDGKKCLYMMEGDDTFSLQSFNGFTIWPGPGNDSILNTGSNSSNNTVTYENGDDTYEMRGSDNSLVLEGYNSTDAVWGLADNSNTMEWYDLTLTLDGNTITLKGQTSAPAIDNSIGFRSFVFDDATISPFDAKEIALDSLPTSGNDRLYGTVDDDTLSPGAGNDTVSLGRGDDTITYTSGRDYYYSGTNGHNTLIVSSYASTDMSYNAHSGRVQMTSLSNNTNQITLDEQTQSDTGPGVRFSTIQFTDIILNSPAEIRQFVLDYEEANDPTIDGTRQAETIEPTAVTVTVRPRMGDDIIIYSPGTTFTIYSDDAGSERNEGNDTLDMSIYTQSQVTATQDGNHIVLTTPGGTVTLKDQVKHAQGAAPYLNIETVLFSDGSWDEAAIRSQAGL